jgi:ubiquinone/menaquinone biosynthesis C-methylase UbiE
MKNQKPLTIENRWDILYRDYPEVYEEFGQFPYKPTLLTKLNQWFYLKKIHILDVGSGTGLSTFQLASKAGWVTGIEPEHAMLEIAIQSAQTLRISNIDFVCGLAEKIPLKDRSVDMVTAITLASLYTEENIRSFTAQAERVVRKGGWVIMVDISPGWYGGNLAHVILGKKTRVLPEENLRDNILAGEGYQHRDFYNLTDYGTVDQIIATYGFIFGMKAIEYIQSTQTTVIKWKWRVHYKRI